MNISGLSTEEEVYQLSMEVEKLLNDSNTDDNFTIIQPYKDSQAIIISRSDHNISININDLTLIMPSKDDVLDVFQNETI